MDLDNLLEMLSLSFISFFFNPLYFLYIDKTNDYVLFSVTDYIHK